MASPTRGSTSSNSLRRPDGRRHRATVGGFPTRKAAQDALDAARAALQKDELVERSAKILDAGMRRGEIAGLRWRGVNLDAGQ